MRLFLLGSQTFIKVMETCRRFPSYVVLIREASFREAERGVDLRWERIRFNVTIFDETYMTKKRRRKPLKLVFLTCSCDIFLMKEDMYEENEAYNCFGVFLDSYCCRKSPWIKILFVT